MIGTFRCVGGVAGDIEDGTHDGYIDWIGRAVACGRLISSASGPVKDQV